MKIFCRKKSRHDATGYCMDVEEPREHSPYPCLSLARLGGADWWCGAAPMHERGHGCFLLEVKMMRGRREAGGGVRDAWTIALRYVVVTLSRSCW